jgi:hypothetical protein
VDWVARLKSTVDRGGVDQRARRCLAGARRAGTRAHRCSPVMVEEDEPDEVVLTGARAAAKELRREGKRGGEGQGLS